MHLHRRALAPTALATAIHMGYGMGASFLHVHAARSQPCDEPLRSLSLRISRTAAQQHYSTAQYSTVQYITAHGSAKKCIEAHDGTGRCRILVHYTTVQAYSSMVWYRAAYQVYSLFVATVGYYHIG